MNTTKTLTSLTYELLFQGGWWMPHEICRHLLKSHSLMVSDSSVTARIRDLRKSRYGGHLIEKRIREGSKAYEYRLVKQPSLF